MRIVQTPGAASAICGVYLLPASMLSLLSPNFPVPPLLLVPAVVFDLVLWLEPAHLVNLWPWTRQRRRRGPRRARPRALLAGAAFGLVFGPVEPPFRLFLGGNPNVWTEQAVALSAALATAVCAGVALLTVRGRAA